MYTLSIWYLVIETSEEDIRLNKTEWVEKTAEITNTHKSVALNVLTTGLTLIKKELSTGNRVVLFFLITTSLLGDPVYYTIFQTDEQL